MSTDTTGTLYVVGTPIGNLDDLSPRARRILDAVDLIAAEDTRRTRGLLSSIEVKSRLIAYHEHNEAHAANEVSEKPSHENCLSTRTSLLTNSRMSSRP